jgi:hypothetical protein
MKKTFFTLIFSAFALLNADAQATRNIDLQTFLKTEKLIFENRTAEALPPGDKAGIRLSARAGDGVAWLKDFSFGNGSIELNIRGKNVEKQSFLGIVFHGDEKNMDVVYFRPFNFLSEDPTKRSHSVQYISLPQYPWDVLREQFPGKYENTVIPVPNPDKWFHIRIEVQYPTIKVYVNDNKVSSLTVNQLNERRTGKIGLYVAYNSGGDFADLKIK